MSKIKLLLSGKVNIQYYIDAVSALGAEPIVNSLAEPDTSYDGLILCGGSDIHPKYYGEPINGSVNIDNERDIAEFALIEAYVKAGKPIFGICRGHQLINIYFGGAMHQHLSEAHLHVSKDGVDSAHEVTAVPDSILSNLYGERFSVNSAHHQAIKALGIGLRPTAYWNGYVEAFEHESMPIFGVQWHPERMCFAKKRDDTVCGAKLFKYFIDFCKNKIVR